MVYSATQWIYGDIPVDQLANRMRSLGCDALELAGTEDILESAERGKLASLPIDVTGVASISVWPNGDRDLSNSGALVRRQAIRYHFRCIDLAKQVGAKYVIVTGTAVGKTRPVSSRVEEASALVDSLRQLGSYAAGKGVDLAIEPINRYESYLVNRVDQAVELIAQAGAPNLKIMIDTFHATMEESNLLHAIQLAGDRLVNVHVAGTNRTGLGGGPLDVRSLITCLKDIGYSGPITCEMFPLGTNPLSGYAPSEDHRLALDSYIRSSIEILKALEAV